MSKSIEEVLKNLCTLRNGLFKDEKSVNDLLDSTIQIVRDILDGEK
jgi:hypothetical protein